VAASWLGAMDGGGGGGRGCRGQRRPDQTWPTGRAFCGPAQSTRARHAESPAQHATKRAVPARERPGAAASSTRAGPARHAERGARQARGLARPTRCALPRCLRSAAAAALFQNLNGSGRCGGGGESWEVVFFWLLASRADMDLGFGGLLVIFFV
jgi:hypothetical protein